MTGQIAVVITCRDLGRTLDEALQSVERQTRPAAEILVVDGGSRDIYTRQVLARLEGEATRVVYGEGGGASTARNLGASLTSSDYLVWLDADDVLEPTYFEVAGARLDAAPDLDFVSCALTAFGAADYVWTPAAPSFIEAVATGGVPHASTMIRRRLWESVGGFDIELRSFELLDFWTSAIEQGFRGVILDQPLLRYRVRPDSGYRRSIQPSTYRARFEHFYAKHRAAIERCGLELIERKESFLLSQREYRRTVEAKAAALEAELARLKLEIAETTRVLESRGLSRVNWGDLHRVEPLSPNWGRDRGTPVDRHYIEGFLERYRGDIRGRVLEITNSVYTERFGAGAVTACDVVDIDPANRAATIVADLRRADAILTGTYDCIILTQTLQLIDDTAAVLAECRRILKPGGVLLVTVPGVIRVDDKGGLDGDYWRLTEASARKLFAEVFPVHAFEVAAYGNVMACAAFLYGMSVEEMPAEGLDHLDANFPLVIAIRATKADNVLKPTISAQQHAPGGRRPVTATRHPAAILAYHRVAELTPDSHALCTPPEEFRTQMRYLRDNFRPIGLDELVDAATSGRIPERAVAVTLDDGYVDALTTASPILSEVGVPATFFVNTDRLDEEHERWWDVLERVFLGDTALPSVLTITIAGQSLPLPTATARERAAALECLSQRAWPLDANARADVVANVLAWSGSDAGPRATHRVLTREEVRLLACRPGHSVGAHTVHHLVLPEQPADTKRREVYDSKMALEHALGRPVELFAYPYGSFDADVVTAVGAARFRAAFTIGPGLVRAGSNRLLLPRYEITAADHRCLPERLQQIFEAATAVRSS